MSTYSYINRTNDLLLTDSWSETSRSVLFQAVDNNYKICTGIQKLAQSVVYLLLTKLGSVKGNPAQGTQFLLTVESGIRDESTLEAALVLAAYDIKRQLNIEITDDTPDDEILDGLTLNSMSLIGSTLSLSVTIQSVAGNSREIVIPIGAVIK